MWLILLLILLAVVVIKLINLHLFWSRQGIKYETFYMCFYRMLFEYNSKPIYELLQRDSKKYGKVYGSYQGLTPMLIVTDVEVAKEVLVRQFGNFFKKLIEFESGDPLWDNMLSQLPYHEWKAVRTIMGQSFTSSKMRGIVIKFDRVATRLSDKLEEISTSAENEIELHKLLKGYGMDAVAAIAFGIDLDCINEPDNEFVKYASDFFKPGIEQMVMMVWPALFKYIPFLNFPSKATSNFFVKLGKHILDEKRQNLDEVIKNDTADILDLHLIAQRDDPTNKISDEVLASQAFLFLVASLDSIVTTLEMVTYYLAINPDVQDRVHDEIRSIMGSRTEVTYEDVRKMKLLEACLLETSRLIPVAIVIDRICTQDTVVAGIQIKRGMPIAFPLPCIHYDPEYFPEPERFMPDRFLKDSDGSSDLSALLSFGDGPKNCVGRRLAIINLQTVVTKILLKLRLEECEATPNPFQMKPGILTTNLSKDPLVIRLSPR